MSFSRLPKAVADPSVPEGVFGRLQREPAYKAVSGVMERRILAGELKAGTPLPSEQELATQFGVNRSTVREAIRQLEQEGLLERHGGGKRLYVVLPGLVDLAPRATRALMLHQVTFQELWEVAVLLEPEAARLAAQRADAADLSEIDDNLGAMVATVGVEGAAERHSEIDVAFHALVARASRNRSLMLAREPFSLLYRPVLTQLQALLPQAARRNLQAHRQITAALRERDDKRAEEWTRKHLIDFRRGFVRAGLAIDAPIDSLPPQAIAQEGVL